MFLFTYSDYLFSEQTANGKIVKTEFGGEKNNFITKFLAQS